MRKMLIGEVAKRAGVTPRTVRYYEQLGLLGEIVQENNGFHSYDEQVLERLNKIAVLKELGLKLNEIQRVIDLYFVDQLQGKRKTLTILEEHLADADRKMAALTQFKAELLQNIERLKGFIRDLE